MSVRTASIVRCSRRFVVARSGRHLRASPVSSSMTLRQSLQEAVHADDVGGVHAGARRAGP
jgi:hypothetical protein